MTGKATNMIVPADFGVPVAMESIHSAVPKKTPNRNRGRGTGNGKNGAGENSRKIAIL